MTRNSAAAIILGLCSALATASPPRSAAALDDALRQYDRAPSPATSAAVDAAAGQKDATVSRLFWHTDFDAARAEAKRTGRPILSLRLLGRLDEELSCANSRFFRTTLYADQAIAAYLRSHYVLHWQSVRPAPKLTVDYGDGRQIVTTITGNSVHYVVDADGRFVDVIPGLYSPARFLTLLTDAERASRQSPDQRRQRFATYADAGLPPMQPLPVAATQPPPAGRAMVITGSKLRAELKPTVVLTGTSTNIDWSKAVGTPPKSAGTDASSGPGAAAVVRFDPAAEALIRRKLPKDLSPAEADRVVEQYRVSVARDQQINDSTLRPRILGRVYRNPSERLPALNDWVYDTVFQTPGSDPWLGLRTADAFNAIENGGLVTRPEAAAAR